MMKLLENRLTKVSLSIFPKDSFTGEAIIGDYQVYINESQNSILKDKIGYILFLDLDLANWDHKIIIESKYYIKRNKLINIRETLKISNKSNIAIPKYTLSFRPKVNYPFPKGTTLIIGLVTNKMSNQPVPGVYLKKGNKTVAITDNNGKFAYFIKNMVNNEKDVTLTTKKTGFDDYISTFKLIKGETQQVSIDLIPV